jgi:hypothetical protein
MNPTQQTLTAQLRALLPPEALRGVRFVAGLLGLSLLEEL